MTLIWRPSDLDNELSTYTYQSDSNGKKKIKRQIISCAGEKAEQLELSSLAVEKAKRPRNFEKHFEQIEEFDSFL